MEDYISREALEVVTYQGIPNGYNDKFDDGVQWMLEQIDALPSADVQLVRRGHWVHDGYDHPHGNDWIHCSECGKRGINVPADLTNYCPNCGARMDGEQNG